MRIPIVTAAACLLFATSFAQSDMAGSGRAIKFDGVDDLINLGNIYDDLDYPFTVSAWVYIDVTSGALPILVTQDNNPIYNGFWFIVNPTCFFIEYGDGRGENLPAYRQGAISYHDMLNKWSHLCAVVHGINDIDLYLNGYHVDSGPTGESPYPMKSNYPNDVAKIGYFLSNSVTYRFVGLMDELRLFSRELSENEIRQQMCVRLTGNENGLIGYWNFDEISGNKLKDLSPNHFDGTLMGNPQRVYSGAPVGNVSVFQYMDTWTSQTVTMTHDDDKIVVSNVSGNPYGVHIYAVTTTPSQTGNLPPDILTKPYYGIFLAGENTSTFFDADFYRDDGSSCLRYTRNDNSVATWTASAPIRQQQLRTEAIITSAKIDVALGPDTVLCDASELKLFPATMPVNTKFEWSTGETTSDITVKQAGIYSLQVKNGCRLGQDTIAVLFLKRPTLLSLGDDLQLCSPSYVLKPVTDVSDASYEWQDGSTGSQFNAQAFGTYTVRAFNACGSLTDSVTISPAVTEFGFIPNVITPDGDTKNEFFKIDDTLVGKVSLQVLNRWGSEIYFDATYHNDWDGHDLSSGVYFYVFRDACASERRGTISVIH